MAKVLTTDNISSMLLAIKDYIDEQCERIVNGCSVSITGNGLSTDVSSVNYLKPAIIEVEADEGVAISSITITMGDTDITSTAWDSTTQTITIAKVTDVISIEATTTSLIAPFVLDGVTASYSMPTLGESWTATLVPDTGKQVLPSSVQVMLDDVDITAEAYDYINNTVNIASVTGEICITASAITMDPTYRLLPYIVCIAVSGKAGFNLGFKPTQDTKIYTELHYIGGTKEYFLPEYGIARTGTHYCTLYVTSSKNVFVWNTVSSGSFTPVMPNNVKMHITIDKGTLTLGWPGQTDIVKTLANDTNFTGSGNLCIFGNRTTSASGVARGRIYCYRHWEDDVLAHDFYPVARVSDGVVGLYNTVASAFNVNYGSATWVAPYIVPTQTLTNCTATRTSAAVTGSATQAVVGSTWSVAITPSSGYTFNDGSAVFQFMVNGVDKTSDCAAYDSSTDTWTITVLVGYNDNMTITATAVAI